MRDESPAVITPCVVEEPVPDESSDIPTRPRTEKPEPVERELETNENPDTSLNKGKNIPL